MIWLQNPLRLQTKVKNQEFDTQIGTVYDRLYRQGVVNSNETVSIPLRELGEYSTFKGVSSRMLDA